MAALPTGGDAHLAAHGGRQHGPPQEKAVEDPFLALQHASYSRQSTPSTQCTWGGSVGAPMATDTLHLSVEASLIGEAHGLSARLREVAALLKEGDKAGRDAALEELKGIAAKEGAALITAIAEHAKDESPWVRQAAIEALAHAQANQGDAVAALLACLGDGTPSVRAGALRALGQLWAGGLDPAVLIGLVDWLEREEDSTIREALVAAVVLTSEEGNAAVIAALVTFSKDFSCWVRLGAAAGLGQLAEGRADGAVLSALAACAADESWQVREAAATSLGRLTWGDRRSAALRAVEGLRADKSPLVRTAAAAAVEAIAKQAGGGQKSEELSAPGDAQQRKSGSNTVLVITSTVATVAFAAAVAAWMRRKW